MIKHLLTLFLFSLLLAPTTYAAGLDCSIGGGVYAENVQVSGYPVWCSAGDKLNASTTASPYCFVRAQTDCNAIMNGGYYIPAPTYTYPDCVPNGYCSAQPVCGTSAVGVDNCNFPCSRSAPSCPANPVNTPTVDQNITNTNTNTNTSSSTSNASAVSQGSVVNITQTATSTREIIREVPVTREVVREVLAVVRVDQPRVVQVSGDSQVKELPKTGPALAGWLLGSLVPVGIGLRRKYGASLQETITPSLLWRNRVSKKS